MELFRRDDVSNDVLLAAAAVTIQEQTGVCIKMKPCLRTWPKKDEKPSKIVGVRAVDGQGHGVFSTRRVLENETIAEYKYDKMYTEDEYATLDAAVKAATRDYAVYADIGSGAAQRTMIVTPSLDQMGHSCGYGQYFNRSCRDGDANVVMTQSQLDQKLYMIAKVNIPHGVHLTWNYNAKVPKDMIAATCLCHYHTQLRATSGVSFHTAAGWVAAQKVLAAQEAGRAGVGTESDEEQ
jgi:hypothetical protein